MKKEKNPKSKKAVLIIVGAVIAVALIIGVANSFISAPTSMMPAKWTDAVYSQSVNVDFSQNKTVTVFGNLDGKEISATYAVTVENDLPVISCTESSGDEAALAKLSEEIVVNALLTFGKSTEIVDGIANGTYGDITCLLQKFTWEIWRGDQELGTATSEMFTWNENLTLQSYTVVTRPDGAPVSNLTFTWN